MKAFFYLSIVSLFFAACASPPKVTNLQTPTESSNKTLGEDEPVTKVVSRKEAIMSTGAKPVDAHEIRTYKSAQSRDFGQIASRNSTL